MLKLRRHFSHVSPGKRSWFLPLAGALIVTLLTMTGCHQDEVQHYRVPKESSSPMPPPGPAMGPGGMSEGAVPAPPRPEGQASLKWTLPKGWSALPSGGMRFATLRAAQAEQVDISVVVLGGTVGGELANVNRWRGQIQLPPIDEQTLAGLRKTAKSKAGQVILFDFTGPAHEKNRLVAGMLQTADGNTWFLKMIGDEEPVGRIKPEFLHWMETLHLD